MQRPRVLCLSAYDAASHRHWRYRLEQGLAELDWHGLSLPPRHFRWRIRGNPLSWLEEPLMREPWDLLLVTSMVDLAVIRGLFPNLAMTPTLAYFHENQFAYPERKERVSSNEPRVVNLYTALAADKVLFNSAWNRDSFIDGARELLRSMPDRKPRAVDEAIRAKSRILPVPVPDPAFTAADRPWPESPHLLWNHRWEYDKGPDRLLALLRGLRRRGRNFRLSLVGEQFRDRPEAFAAIRREFADCLVHDGFVASSEAYSALLKQADIVLSTALHDFQGLAILEAMAAGCVPVVPDRLAYPEYVPPTLRYPSLPEAGQEEGEGAAELIDQLLARSRPAVSSFSPHAYRESQLLPTYRREFHDTLAGLHG